MVVNSAGVLSAGLLISSKGLTVATKEMERVFKINVVGTFNVTKFAALEMSK